MSVFVSSVEKSLSHPTMNPCECRIWLPESANNIIFVTSHEPKGLAFTENDKYLKTDREA